MRLEYQISATGVGQLKRVFRSVEQEAQTASRRAVDRSTRMWARNLAQVKHELARTEAAGAGVGASGQARAAVPGAPGRTLYSREHSARMANITREERARLRAISRETALSQRGEVVKHRLRLRNIEREEARRLVGISTGRRREQERWPITAARLGHGAARVVGGAIGTVGRVAGAALALGGGLGAVSAIQSQTELAGRTSSLANQAGIPERKGEIFRAVQNVRGARAESATAALEQWQGLTGNLPGGMKILPQLNKIAIATGTDLGDMAAAAGNALNTLATDISDPTEQLKALDRVMRTIGAQGAIGAVEVSALATEMAGLAASAGSFAGGAEQSIKQMGAMAQVSRALGGASSAAEAITSIERFTSDITTNAKKLRELGLTKEEIWTNGPKGKQLLPQQQLVENILVRTKGDPEKVAAIFGAYGKRAVGGFARLYQAAEAEAKAKSKQTGTKWEKGAAGKERVRAEFAKYMDVQTGEDEINRRYESRMQDADIKMAELAKRFNDEVGSRLIPVFDALIPKIADAIPSFANVAEAGTKFAAWALKNPYHGVGAIIAGLVAKDLLAAGIGKAASAAFSGIMANQKLAVGSMVIGAVAGGITMAKATIAYVQSTTEGNVRQETERGESLLAKAKEEMQTRGHLSQETLAGVERLKQTRERQQIEGKAEIERSGTLTGQITAGAESVAGWFGYTAPLQERSDLMAGATDTGLEAQRAEAASLLAAQSIWEKTGADFAGTVTDLGASIQELKIAAKDISDAAKRTGGGPDAPSAKRQSPVLNRGG